MLVKAAPACREKALPNCQEAKEVNLILSKIFRSSS